MHNFKTLHNRPAVKFYAGIKICLRSQLRPASETFESTSTTKWILLGGSFENT